MLRDYDRKLIFEDGTEYYGYSFGDDCEKVCEIVFNTSMVGYQEILSDPSYTYQAVVMTYPLIGNYGMADEDYETGHPTLGAFIVGEYNDSPSNFRSTATLGSIMKKYHIPGVSGVDTRRLTRSIRDYGSRKVLITDVNTSLEAGLKKLAETDVPWDSVDLVSPKAPYVMKAGSHYDNESGAYAKASGSDVSGSNEPQAAACEGRFHVVAVDCGMKRNIVRSLNARGCDVTIVPYNTTPDYIRSLNPDGIFLSNGPGDPEDVTVLIETVRTLKGEYPIFGICLGHQIISLAYGGSCYKLKFGHRGGNHPVKNLKTGRIEITSQNHSYAADPESLKNTKLTVTHINLLDNTVEGVECVEDRIFSVQYHPESAPGPEDSGYLFDRFIAMMQEEKDNA